MRNAPLPRRRIKKKGKDKYGSLQEVIIKRSNKTVGIKVFLIFLLDDRRIRIHASN
jgi:hypothetical protein